MLTKIKSSVSMSSFHPLQAYFSQLSIINLNPRPDLLRLPNLLYFSNIFQGTFTEKRCEEESYQRSEDIMNLGAAATFTEQLYF